MSWLFAGETESRTAVARDLRDLSVLDNEELVAVLASAPEGALLHLHEGVAEELIVSLILFGV